jgi:rubrerythrin
MHEMTATNLRSAYGGESMAHVRYRTWARRADRDGFPNVARLFRAIAFAEEVHANNHFEVLRRHAGAFTVCGGAGFGIGPTSSNLAGAIEGETFEITEMYPAYKAVAEVQGEARAAQSFGYALSAEQEHAALYAAARHAVDRGEDIDLGPVQICEVCGHTVEGRAPAVCPVCKAGRNKFRAFEQAP